MKKIISLLIAILIIFSLAACNKDISFEEFETKYKRADYNSFIDDPTEFLTDFEKLSKQYDEYPKTAFDFLKEWSEDEAEERETELSRVTDKNYRKKGILFNKSVEFKASLISFEYLDEISHVTKKITYSLNVYIKFETGNDDTDFEIAKSLTNVAFNMYGEPKEIELSLTDCSEMELRKMLESGEKETFSLYFDGLIISYYYFNGITSHSSNLSIY